MTTLQKASCDPKSRDEIVESAGKVSDYWDLAVHMLQELVAQAVCPDPFSLTTALDACHMPALQAFLYLI